mgnify:CR=1 FL=1
MKIHCFKIQYLFFAFALFTAFSCGNSKEKELDRLVVSLASEDKETKEHLKTFVIQMEMLMRRSLKAILLT